MKKKLLLIILGVILIGAIIIGLIVYCNIVLSCKYSNISFRVTLNNEVVTTCDNAYISLLSGSRGFGGYRFNCGQETSVYVIYSTELGPPVDGTIKMIWAEDKIFHTAYFAPNEDCPSAKALKRTVGEPPLPTTFFGDIKKGRYVLMLAKPCGELVLEIAEPIVVE